MLTWGATVLIAGVVVEDADASGTNAVRAFNGIDGGNNQNWSFDGSMWTGGGTVPVWSDPVNWGGVPISAGNLVAFWHTGGASLMDLPTFTIAALDISRFTGTLVLDEDLTVSMDAEIVAGTTLDTGGRIFNVSALTVDGELANTGGAVWADSSVWMNTGTMELHGGLAHFAGSVEVAPSARIEVHSGSEVHFTDVVIIDGFFHAYGESTLVAIAPQPNIFNVGPTGSFVIAGQWPPSINLYSTAPSTGPRWTLSHLSGAVIDVEGARIQDSFANPDLSAYNSADDGNNLGWHFVISGAEDTPAVPRALAAWNAPNPFNPTTTVFVELPSAGEVTVRVYDVRGRLVRTLLQELRPAGLHPVVWDARDDQAHEVASGIYLYDVVHAGRHEGGKMVLLK